MDPTKWWPLFLPFLVSLVPVAALLFGSVIKVSPSDVEGTALVMGLLILALFALVGPLAGVTLSVIMRDQPISLAAFVRLTIVATLPTLLIQLFPGLSLPALLEPNLINTVPIYELSLLGFMAGIVAYIGTALVLYPIAKRSVAKTIAVAIPLVVLLFSPTLFRLWF